VWDLLSSGRHAGLMTLHLLQLRVDRMVEYRTCAEACDVSDRAIGEQLVGLKILPQLLRDIGRVSGDKEQVRGCGGD